MTSYKHLALFVGGVLFGSAGFKLLSSQDAKKAYTHATAAVLRAKDDLMETVTSVQENAADILASAKDLNEQRAAQETVVEDASGEAEGSVEA
jgi:predicted  nucleic acid-binding Zn-ribbon protein